MFVCCKNILGLPHTCACKDTWQTPYCLHRDCPKDKQGHVCGAHGVCQDGTCLCEPGRSGTTCEMSACPTMPIDVEGGDAEHAQDGSLGLVKRDWLGLSLLPPPKKRILVECSGNGKCTKHGQCDCLNGWIGAACEILKCKFNCHGRGKCLPRLSVKNSKSGDKYYRNHADKRDRQLTTSDALEAAEEDENLTLDLPYNDAGDDAREIEGGTSPGRCSCTVPGWEGP